MTTTNAAKVPVTSRNAYFQFYDIEALQNVFSLCIYDPRKNNVLVFYLVEPGTELAAAPFDEDAAIAKIIAENPALKERIAPASDGSNGIWFLDLATYHANRVLASTFGLSDAYSVNDPTSESNYAFEPRFRLVCDTDVDVYDPINTHPYLAGYNSYNYDTTMLAIYLQTAFANRKSHEGPFQAVSPKQMRQYNDQLFTDEFRSYMPSYLTSPEYDTNGWDSVGSRIRQNMLHSGRHVDIARLNEVQQRVGLKRLLGAIGRQILESDKLGGHNAVVQTSEELYDLLAYNVSDVVGLHRLFEDNIYSSGFDLKKGLLDEYPETIYAKQKEAYAPDINPASVRRNRLTPDSTSAKFVGIILSPYGDLKDLETVSFMYPSQMVADERNIERVNVLEECKNFFYENISDPYARAEFDEVYKYYKSIEGQNFNDSDEYFKTHDGQNRGDVKRLAGNSDNVIPKTPNNLPYFTAEGRPTTCFATFSTGGIHGAEANHDLFEAELAEWEAQVNLVNQVKSEYPDPLTIRQAKQGVVLSNGTIVTWKEVLSSKTRLMDCKAISEEIAVLGGNPTEEQIQEVYDRRPGVGYKEPKARPVLFDKKQDGSTKLKTKYTWTSMDLAIHEDFTSYYPNMLRNMSAFYNEQLGEDRYAKILEDKDRYQVLKKEAAARGDHVEAARFDVLRNGTKLILNSASGAGDTQHKTPIRVNNAIISMRIVGQLFSWRIGQAQTLAGARIISTNTDGLYSVLDEETNNRVLEEQAAIINVAIEPEPLLIVSKDSNNRLEIEPVEEGSDTPPWEAPIISASGGTLACFRGPRPDKSLAHPAVLDWALAHYLRYIAGGYTPEWATEPLSLDKPLDRRLALQLMTKAVNLEDAVLAARLFQNVIAASPGKFTFPFAADPVDPVSPDPSVITNPRALQHYTRVFFVHAGKPGAVSLRAAGSWAVPASSRARRAVTGVQPPADPIAQAICEANGYTLSHAKAAKENLTVLPSDQDVAVRKLVRIEPSWNAIIENRDLVCLDNTQIRELLGCLDLNVYVNMLADTFENNWMRVLGDQQVEETEDEG